MILLVETHDRMWLNLTHVVRVSFTPDLYWCELAFSNGLTQRVGGPKARAILKIVQAVGVDGTVTAATDAAVPPGTSEPPGSQAAA